MLDKVLRADLKDRVPTEEEQALINDRALKGEPLYDEDRETLPAEDTKKKEEELKGQKGTDLKDRAKKAGLSETATEQEVAAKEEEQKKVAAEGKKDEPVDDDQKSFKEADKRKKLDMIAEKEVELAEEQDAEKKQSIEAMLDAWKKDLSGTSEKGKETDLDEVVKKYAEKKNVSLDEAREEIESRQAILSKYSSDPLELAGAYRSLQKEHTKTKDEHLKTVKALEVNALHRPVDPRILEPEKILRHPDGKELTRETIVELVRQKHPKKTEAMDDDAVYEIAQDELAQVIETRRKTDLANIKSEAKSRRVELLSKLPKDAEPYKEIIQKELDSFPDARVVEKDFTLQDIVWWCKGQNFETAIEEAETRGYKRGIESRRILGERKSPVGGAPKKNSSGDTGTFGLDKDEQKKALEAFASDQVPDKRKLELYAYSIGKIDKVS